MMRIEFLSGSPDRSGRHTTRFDDGSTLRLYRQTVEDFGLYVGMELSEENMQMLRDANGRMSAKMRAVRIVAATNVSSRDLEQRLVRKGENPEDARQAVNWMENLNLLDDRRTAEHVVESCIQKGYGFNRTKQVLFEKRIPREYWDDILEDYPDQMDKIEVFLRSRLDENSDARDIKRAVDALIRRGHNYSRIRQVLNNLSFDSENFLEE